MLALRTMTQRVAGFALFSLLLDIAGACGGSARIDSAGVGGAGNSAGMATGGAGQAAGVGNAAGAAGSLWNMKGCYLEKEPGPCDASVPSFWHNSKTGLCEPFIYGGCGGNLNRFATRNECLTRCPGSAGAWGSCVKDSECVLTTLGCCQGCEPLNDQDFVALNAAHAANEWATRLCTPIPACAPCPPSSESGDTGKFFKPVCASGQCSAVDIRESPITECQVDGDCVLRAGVACCTSCNGGFVSVNKNTNFCPDGPVPCPQCASPSPEGLLAQCVQNRCVVAFR